MNISKELLSEVLNVNITSDHIVFENTLSDNIEYYTKDGIKYISIYKLAFKCKEWAFNKGYRIESAVAGAVIFTETRDNTFDYVYGEPYLVEIEAIVACCEWVIKQKVDKNE